MALASRRVKRPERQRAFDEGRPMRLLAKFSLIFVVVFGVGLGGAAYLFYRLLQRNAREQVLYNAQIMLETALAARSYTTEHVAPALLAVVAPPGGQPAKADPAADDVFRDLCAKKGYGAGAKRVFRSERIPAFGATEIFNYLRKKYPDYFYKEAALNPTNPRDRALDWEEDIIKAFKNQADLKLFEGERDTPLGRSLYLARPLRAEKSCLQCHSTPSAAPPEMIDVFGPANGFGWTEGDIIAAQIVSVPVSLPVAMAERAFRRLVWSLVLVGLVTLGVLNLLLYVTVIRPVSRFAARADEISKGQLDVPELPVRGRDEISILAAAFNRMHRSLSTAMSMLEKE
jgi:protein-histidine pros-kinase